MTNDEKDDILSAAQEFYNQDDWVVFYSKADIEEDVDGDGYWVEARVWISKELVRSGWSGVRHLRGGV
jgi:hypothetical protein